MSQFAGGKNPPWARPAAAPEFLQVPPTSSIPQTGVGNPTVFSLGNSATSLGAPQYTAQQLAAVGLQAQQQAAAVLQPPPGHASQTGPGPVLSQPGIALPTTLATTLATTQVATVSYPAPRLAQQSQKQRVFTGTITKLHDNFGFVDENVFFQSSCVKGSVPKLGDRVLVEATYNANMPFKWNATRIQVLPNQQQNAGGQTGFNKQVGSSSLGLQTSSSMMHSNMQQPPVGPGLAPIPSQPQPLVTNNQGSRVGPSQSKMARIERGRERKREQDKRDRLPAPRKRSRTRSPPKRNESAHQRSPARRRPRIVPRYLIQVPKLSFDMKDTNVVSLKSRYTSLYIPSDFFHANFSWTEAFPLRRPFQLGNSCNFHLMHKDVEPVAANDAVLDPSDTDHTYSAKVMLLSCPALEDLYHKSCALAQDSPEIQEAFVHPTRLIHFLVGLKGKNETMAIGGPWSPSLDGPNPGSDPRVLIKTAIRTTKALTGVDLSNCTQWYRFAEIQYLRPGEQHKGRHLPQRVETTVIFLPDVWSCSPTRLEWGSLQLAYKKQLQKKLSLLLNPASKEEAMSQEEEGENTEPVRDPTHFSELDPKTMKIIDLRRELESRTLSSRGLKSQLIARLTKAMKSEEEQEKNQESMETGEETVAEDSKKTMATEEDDKTDDKKKEEEDRKKKEEKEKASLERKYNIPDDPAVLVHPNTLAKGGKFDCAVMSLSVLLDYRPEDNKEHSFEVSLFAELFNEMLMRDFGFEIYTALFKAPEKKEEEKKEKKNEEKSSKEGKSSKRKSDEREKEKDKRDGEKKDSKEKEKTRKEEEKSEEKTEEKMEDEGNEEDLEDKNSKKESKDKKKEKRKFQTKDPRLLLAFTYFDQNHTGYVLDKDMEEILHTIGLQLSRAQVKKLVQKVVSRDAVNYRKLTDKPVVVTSDKDDGEGEVKECAGSEAEKLAQGNLEFLHHPGTGTDSQNDLSHSQKDGEGDANDKREEGSEVKQELVMYQGSMLDVACMMGRLERSERTRTQMEGHMQALTAEKDDLKKNLDQKEDAITKLTNELKQVKQKLSIQEKGAAKAESLCKKYLSSIAKCREHASALMECVSEVLSDRNDNEAGERTPKDKGETKVKVESSSLDS